MFCLWWIVISTITLGIGSLSNACLARSGPVMTDKMASVKLSEADPAVTIVTLMIRPVAEEHLDRCFGQSIQDTPYCSRLHRDTRMAEGNCR